MTQRFLDMFLRNKVLLVGYLSCEFFVTSFALVREILERNETSFHRSGASQQYSVSKNQWGKGEKLGHREAKVNYCKSTSAF